MAEPRTVRENANALNSEQIAALLPHRYPFALVDRILDYEPGQWAIGRKCVSRNEEFFCGHFPFHQLINSWYIVIYRTASRRKITLWVKVYSQHLIPLIC